MVTTNNQPVAMVTTHQTTGANLSVAMGIGSQLTRLYHLLLCDALHSDGGSV